MKVGDKIIIGTTSHNNLETDGLLTISNYDETTDPNLGIITVLEAIQFDHYGDLDGNIRAVTNADPGLNGQDALKQAFPDERADVLMVTRNIKIGANPNDVWGEGVAVTQIGPTLNDPTANISYKAYGRADLNQVEFINIGQKDTFFSGLRFIKLSDESEYTIRKYKNNVINCSFKL